MGVVFIATHPRLAPLRFTLQGEATVGHGAECDFVLPSPELAREHARLLYRDSRVIVSDLGTAGGTFVNGRRIDRATFVRPGETVTVGDWQLRADELERPEPAFAPRSAREKELVDALAASPHDDELRQVYGDWLEENGHRDEAELLSLEREIRRGGEHIDEQERGRLGYRLRLVAEKVAFAWRAVVERPLIEGCHVGHGCPAAWDRLQPTTDFLVRWCAKCQHSVYLTETIDIARRHVGQRRKVAVDAAVTRYPRDLEVALALIEAPAIPQLPGPRPITDLPIFAQSEPPGTVGEVLRSIGIGGLPETLEEPSMGWFSYRADQSPDIVFVSFKHDWDMYHEAPRTLFSQIARSGYETATVNFRRGAADIEAWLKARFGEGRPVTHTPDFEGARPMEYRVYGKCLAYRADEQRISLEWPRTLPEWALPKTDSRAALEFLRALATFLRETPDFEHVKDFASRPPAGSGVVVRGEWGRDRFGFGFEPKVSALDVAAALAVPQPVGSSGDVHMSTWMLESLDRDSELVFGSWTMEVYLDGWPSGEDVPERRATQRLGAKDRVRALEVRRPRK